MRLDFIKARPNHGPVAQLVGASSCTVKGGGFDFQSGHIPEGTNEWSLSHQCFYLSKINKPINQYPWVKSIK